MTSQTYAERTKGLIQPGCGLKTTEWLLRGYEFSRKHGAYLTAEDIDFLDRMIASMKADIIRFRAERIARVRKVS